MSEVRYLQGTKGNHTPHTLVTELAANVDEIEEIYIVVKGRTSQEYDVLQVGNLQGLCFAHQLLQCAISIEIDNQ